MECEHYTYAAGEAAVSGLEPSSDGIQSSHSITINGAARLWHPMDGLASPPSAATSKDSIGILSQSAAWIASQRASLAAILALLEDEQGLMASRPVPHGEDACKQLSIFDLPGCSSKTAPESSHTDQPYGEPCESEDTIPEMAHLMPPMSERRTYGRGGLCSHTAPTLTVHGNYNRKGCSATSGDGLATWCKKTLPTLLRTDATKPRRGRGSVARGGGEKLTDALLSRLPQTTAAHTIGIRLTPDFCEWWMGWPIGASASLHSATRGSHCKRRSRGDCSEGL